MKLVDRGKIRSDNINALVRGNNFRGPFFNSDATYAAAWRGRSPVQQVSNLLGHLIGRHHQRFVDMDVALGHPAGRVAQQRRDGQF